MAKHNFIDDEAMLNLIDQYLMFYMENNPLDPELEVALKKMITPLVRLAMEIGYEVAESEL